MQRSTTVAVSERCQIYFLLSNYTPRVWDSRRYFVRLILNSSVNGFSSSPPVSSQHQHAYSLTYEHAHTQRSTQQLQQRIIVERVANTVW